MSVDEMPLAVAETDQKVLNNLEIINSQNRLNGQSVEIGGSDMSEAHVFCAELGGIMIDAVSPDVNPTAAGFHSIGSDTDELIPDSPILEVFSGSNDIDAITTSTVGETGRAREEKVEGEPDDDWGEFFSDLSPPQVEATDSTIERAKRINELLVSPDTAERSTVFIEEVTAFVINSGGDYGELMKLGTELAGNIDDFKVILLESVSDPSLSVWKRSSLLQVCEKVLYAVGTDIKYTRHTDSEKENLELSRAQLAEHYKILKTKISDEIPGGNDSVLKLMKLYPDLCKESDVGFPDLHDYHTIIDAEPAVYTSSIDLVPVKIQPSVEEVRSLAGRLNSLDVSTRIMILNSYYDRKVMFENSEFIDSYMKLSRDPEEKKEIERLLVDLTGAMSDYEIESPEIFVRIATEFESLGLEKNDVLKLLSGSKRLKEIDLVAQSDDGSSSIALLAKLAKSGLLFFKNDVYSEGSYDERVLAINRALQTPELYSGYIDEISPLIEDAKSAGFPIETIATRILHGIITPKWVEEGEDMFTQEVSILKAAVLVGDELNMLAKINPDSLEALLVSVTKNEHNIEEQLDQLKSLVETLDELKSENPELAEWVCESIYNRILKCGLEGLPAFVSTLEFAKYARTVPALEKLITNSLEGYKKDRDQGELYYTKNWIKLDLSKPYYNLGKVSEENGEAGVKEYIDRLDLLMPLCEAGKLNLQSALDLALDHSKVEVGTLFEILSSDVYREILNHPDITMYSDETDADNEANIFYKEIFLPDLFVKLGGTKKMEKLFKDWQEFDNKTWFPLIDFASSMVELKDSIRVIDTEEYTKLEATIVEVLLDASTMTDKDGFPYESIDSVFGMLRNHLFKLEEKDRTEFLEWFQLEDIPYSTIPIVMSSRENAISDGIEDNPKAIFEWAHNPANRELASRKVLFDYLRINLGLSPEDIEEAAKLAEEDSDNFRVVVNIDQGILAEAAINGGDLKSIFDAGVFEGASKKLHIGNKKYLLHRSGVEIAMGLRSLDEETDHPVYGSCIFAGNDSTKRGAYGYGDTVIVLDPEKVDYESRVTFTPEDSFHGATLLTQEDAKILRKAKDIKGLGGVRTNEYVEAQIVGGLDLSMVSEFRVSSVEEAESLKQLLPSSYHGIIVIIE